MRLWLEKLFKTPPKKPETKGQKLCKRMCRGKRELSFTFMKKPGFPKCKQEEAWSHEQNKGIELVQRKNTCSFTLSFKNQKELI